MAIQTCIRNIIQFKNTLLQNYSTNNQTMNRTRYYADLLTSTSILSLAPDLSSGARKNRSYLNSYFHASLISVFMEKEGHTLKNWMNYSKEIVPVLKTHPYYGQYLSKFTESDVLEFFILHTVNHTFQLNNTIALTTNSDSNPTKFYDDFLNERLPEEITKKILENVQITMKIRG